MSCLESIQKKLKNQTGNGKFFGGYDTIDYSGRPLQVLKEQLRLGLYQVQFSVKEFNKDYNNGYALPKDYNMDKVFDRLEKFYDFFVSKGEKDCQRMTIDFHNILSNKNCARFYTGVKFQSEAPKNMSEKAYDMVKASKYTHEQQQQIQELYRKYPNMRPEDIPSKLKYEYEHCQNQHENNSQKYNGSSGYGSSSSSYSSKGR